MKMKEGFELRANLTPAFCAMVAAAWPNIVHAQETGIEEEVVVTATRSERALLEVPAAVTAEGMDELRQQGFTYGTDEFRGVPGVYFRRGEGDGDEFPYITIRGVTGNHGNDTFLALVDGIPFVGPDEEVLLYQVPYAAVERIEIVRGPVSALYGRGAIAGAVNYLTRNPGSDGSRVSLSAGSDDYYRAEALFEQATEGAAFLGSVAYEDHEGWREHSARQALNLFAKGSFELSDRTTLSVYLNYIDRDSEVPGAIPALADGTVVDVGGGRERFLGYGDTRNTLDGWLGALRLEHQVFDSLDLTLTAHARTFDTEVFLNFYDSFAFNPDANIMTVNGFGAEGSSDVLFAEGTVHWRSGRHDVVTGFSAEQTTQQEREFWSGQFGFTFECGFAFYMIEIDYTTGQLLNGNHPCFVNDQLEADADTTNRFWSVFIQDEIALADRLTLTLGGRYDAFERDVTFSPISPFNPGGDVDGDSSSFSPKAALSWRVGQGQVYAAYGRGFNSNFGPVWQWDPSQYARTEEPTTIDSAELGWKSRAFDNRLTFEAALFHLEQKHRRIFVTNPDPTGPANLATTGQRYETTGLEVALELRPSPDTTLSLTCTWLDPEWTELDVSGVDFSGVEPTGVPNYLVYVAAEHRFAPWLRARAVFEWYDDYQITLDNTSEGGAYELLSLSGVIDFSERVALDLSLTNALDEEYYAYFGNETDVTHATPGAPRQLRATLRARF